MMYSAYSLASLLTSAGMYITYQLTNLLTYSLTSAELLITY